MSTGNDYISFKIWGCTPAIIGLLSEVGVTISGLKAFEVAIGLDNNTHIAIFRSQVSKKPLSITIQKIYYHQHCMVYTSIRDTCLIHR